MYDTIFCLWYMQFQKFVKTVWRKHNLIISPSAGSDPGKFNMRTPINNYYGEGTSYEKNNFNWT